MPPEIEYTRASKNYHLCMYVSHCWHGFFCLLFQMASSAVSKIVRSSVTLARPSSSAPRPTWRRRYSAHSRFTPLYVTGPEATSNHVAVLADHADGQEVLKEGSETRREMEKSIEARGHDLDIGLTEMAEKLARVRSLEKQRSSLVAERAALGLAAKGGGDEAAAAKERLVEVKALLNKCAADRVDLDQSAVRPFILGLPNDLHKRCPSGDSRILPLAASNAQPPKFSFPAADHLALASDELDFCLHSSDAAFYLFGRLAQLELALGWRAQSVFGDQLRYSAMTGPDFVKSVVIDACGEDHRCGEASLSVVPCKEMKGRDTGYGQHLVGSASLFSMISYWCKNVIRRPASMPLSHYTLGRQYRPKLSGYQSPNLFTTQQSTAVQLLTLSASPSSSEEQLEETMSALARFYDELGVHYRMVAVSAKDLGKAERFRMSVQMYTTQGYREVGNVSDYGSYISRRLMLKTEEQQQQMKNVHVVGGTAIDITKFIGCAVEGSQKKDGSYDLGTLSNLAQQMWEPK